MLEWLINGGTATKDLKTGTYVFKETIARSLNFGSSVAVSNEPSKLVVGDVGSSSSCFYDKTIGGNFIHNKDIVSGTGGLGKRAFITPDGKWSVISNESSGLVIVYKNDGTGVNEYQTISRGEKGFGRSVCMNSDGSKLFIGAVLANKVFVYNKIDGGYTLSQIIQGRTWTGGFVSVSDNGDTLITSAYGVHETYIYSLSSLGQYELSQTIVKGPPEDTFFGAGAVISGDGKTLIAGSGGPGLVYAYKLDGSGLFIEMGKIKPPSSFSPGVNNYGYLNAINYDGTIVGCGTIVSNDVLIFHFNGVEFENINHFTGSAGFGMSLSLSPDAKNLVVGDGNGKAHAYEFVD